jgi:hypothetical protein
VQGTDAPAPAPKPNKVLRVYKVSKTVAAGPAVLVLPAAKPAVLPVPPAVPPIPPVDSFEEMLAEKGRCDGWWKGTFGTAKFRISYPRLMGSKQKQLAVTLRQVRATLSEGPAVHVRVCRPKDAVTCKHELTTEYTVVACVADGEERVSKEFLSGHAKCALLEYLIRADEDGGYSCR